MSVRRGTAGAALAAMVLAGCGGGGDEPGASAESESSEPVTVDVTVELIDRPPQSILFNHDGDYCLSIDLVQALIDAMDNGGEAQPAERPEVTLRDADGSIVGVKRLPKVGGLWDGGCWWDVDFRRVPASDFYEATITSPAGEAVGRAKGQADGGSIVRVRI